MSNEEKWTAHVSAWRASGLSGAAYCRENGLKISSLRYWSSRLGGGAPKGVRMARVKKVGGKKPTESLGGTLRLVSVEVPADLDTDALRQVLSLFGARR